MFNETKSISECIKKCAIVFVTIRFTTEDQCIPTITKLNIKKATTGLEVIFKVLINGLTEISSLISLCIPINKRAGETRGGVFDRVTADTLYISGRMSDGVITDLDGKWEEVMGYKHSELKGLKYDGENLIHPDDLQKVKNIEKNLKESTTIYLTRYSTIQRWKHGKTGEYIMLSMVWDVNVEEDVGVVGCKPIDGFISA